MELPGLFAAPLAPPPGTLTGVQLWFSTRGPLYADTTFNASAVTNGASVAAAPGYLGTALAGTQASAGNRPTVQTAGIGSVRALGLNGSQWLDYGNVCDFDRTDAFTVYAVFKNSTQSDALQEVVSKGDQASVKSWTIGFAGADAATNPVVATIHFAFNTPGQQNRVASHVQSMNPAVGAMVACRNSGSGRAAGMDIFINRVKQSLAVFNDTMNVTAKNPGTLQVGALFGMIPFQGSIAEVVICTGAHADADVIANMDYLNRLGYSVY